MIHLLPFFVLTIVRLQLYSTVLDFFPQPHPSLHLVCAREDYFWSPKWKEDARISTQGTTLEGARVSLVLPSLHDNSPPLPPAPSRVPTRPAYYHTSSSYAIKDLECWRHRHTRNEGRKEGERER